MAVCVTRFIVFLAMGMTFVVIQMIEIVRVLIRMAWHFLYKVWSLAAVVQGSGLAGLFSPTSLRNDSERFLVNAASNS
jgi:hypothetical protein